jgi:hypothetical protein
MEQERIYPSNVVPETMPLIALKQCLEEIRHLHGTFPRIAFYAFHHEILLNLEIRWYIIPQVCITSMHIGISGKGVVWFQALTYLESELFDFIINN